MDAFNKDSQVNQIYYIYKGDPIAMNLRSGHVEALPVRQ